MGGTGGDTDVKCQARNWLGARVGCWYNAVMRFAAGPPTGWTVELLDGTVVEVWADGFSRDGDYYTFSSLVDLDEGEQLPAGALVLGEVPSNPTQSILAIARFPKACVRLPEGDEESPAIFSQ